MFRSTRHHLTDSYKEFSTTILRKLRSAATAVELAAAVKQILLNESGALADKQDDPRRAKMIDQLRRQRMSRRQQENEAALTHSRLVSAVGTMLTECQTHQLWRQAIVVIKTAHQDLGLEVKQAWPQMALSAAPDLQTRAEVLKRLREVAGTTAAMMAMSVSSSRAARMKEDESDERSVGEDDFSRDGRSNATTGADQLALTSSDTILSKLPSITSTRASLPPSLSSPSSSSSLSSATSNTINPLFVHFYLRQRVARNEAEMSLLVDALQARPRLCFRVNSIGLSAAWADLVADAAQRLSNVEPVRWCSPRGLVFRLKQEHDSDVRSSPSSSADLNAGRGTAGTASITVSRNWLRRHAEQGLVSIQSPSSLLAGSLVDAQPDDAVLDMCAAPGSKTRQLLEQQQHIVGREGKGVVLANEPSVYRQRELQVSLSLQNSNNNSNNNNNNRNKSGINRTNESALFPNVAFSRCAGVSVPTFPRLGLFDRVLVDAPCSGDGMIHKSPLASWARWTPSLALPSSSSSSSSDRSRNNSEGFHQQQVALLRHAVRLTKPGGRIVYSTCTMNPLENEAVVAAVLREGLCDLIPISAVLQRQQDDAAADSLFPFSDSASSFSLYAPRLSPGLPEWVVPVRDWRPGAQPYSFVSSMLPLGGTTASSSSSSSSLSLVRQNIPPPSFFNHDASGIGAALRECCGRLYPHVHRGFDAFFVAVLIKKLVSSSSTHYLHQQQQQQHPSVVTEARRVKERTRDGEQVMGNVVLPHFGILRTENGTSSSSGNRSSYKFQLVSQQLRVMTEKAWALACDDSHPLDTLQIPGSTIARVLANQNNATTAAAAATTTMASVRLTFFGAMFLMSFYEREQQRLRAEQQTQNSSNNNNNIGRKKNIVFLPVHVFRLWIGAATTSSSGGVSEQTLALDDRAKMRKGRAAVLAKEKEDHDDDGNDLQRLPDWFHALQDTCCGASSGPIIVCCSNPSAAASSSRRFSIGVPARRIVDDRAQGKKSFCLVCDLDPADRQRLNTLLGSVAALPESFHEPKSTASDSSDKTRIKFGAPRRRPGDVGDQAVFEV